MKLYSPLGLFIFLYLQGCYVRGVDIWCYNFCRQERLTDIRETMTNDWQLLLLKFRLLTFLLSVDHVLFEVVLSTNFSNLNSQSLYNEM